MPSEKRARQRAGRNARVVELQRAQQRRRRLRFGGVVAVLVLIAIGLIIRSSTGPSSTTTTTTKSKTPTAVTPSLSAAKNPLCNGTTPQPAEAKVTTPASGPAVSVVDAPAGVPFPKLDGTVRFTKFTAAPPRCIDTTKTYTAVVTTDVGSFTITLDAKAAPITVNNFVFLAGYHYFDGTIFHRVIPGFIDQGGDPTGTGTGGPGYTFKDELPTGKNAYASGTVAMANSGANTNGSQFFVCVGTGGASLQDNYSVFGHVTAGMSVASAINTDGASSGTPKVVHKIVSVHITES